LVARPLASLDKEVLAEQAEEERARPEETVDVRFNESARDAGARDAGARDAGARDA
jgi:hypothetical protein